MTEEQTLTPTNKAKEIEDRLQKQETHKRTKLVLLACLILVAVIVLLLLLFPTAARHLPPPVTYRTVIVLFDQTDSNGEFKTETKSQVKDRVLSRIAPGDYIACYQVDSDRDAFNEKRNLVFKIDEEAARFPQGLKDDQRNEELKKKSVKLDDLKRDWEEQLNRANPPSDKRYSDYLSALRYIGDTLRMTKRGGVKWLIVIGDMFDEPYLADLKKKRGPTQRTIDPPDAQGEDKNQFKDVHILLALPSGAQDSRIQDSIKTFWQEYFSIRGGKDIRFSSFNNFTGLPRSELHSPE